MAKKTNSSNFVNFMRSSERISDNVIVGGNSWDYSFILLVSGMLPETDIKVPGKRKAGEFSAWLCQEVMKRLFRFKFSKRQDNLSLYIKAFLEDHQEGKLKRWIRDKISYSSLRRAAALRRED